MFQKGKGKMKDSDFMPATASDREKYVVRPYETVPNTNLVKGSDSHLVFGQNVMLSFLTMKAGSIFELHSHPEEQVMVVLNGYCDEIIEDKMYRVNAGDVIHLPANVSHGAFLRDVDCKVMDVFSPPRRDYAKKFQDQHPGVELRFYDR
jgi:quercetin dioxygenase-like cupin family protein